MRIAEATNRRRVEKCLILQKTIILELAGPPTFANRSWLTFSGAKKYEARGSSQERRRSFAKDRLPNSF